MVGLNGRIERLERSYGPASCPTCRPPDGAPRFTFITEDCPPAPPCPTCGQQPIEFSIDIGSMNTGLEGPP